MNGISPTDLGMFADIAGATLLGYVIGWERELRGSKAGNRTFSLVTLAAAAFTSLGVAYFPETAEKVFAGIVSGVGFLGAGMIFKAEDGVFGLTTAASLWAVAAIGTVAGSGHLALGALLTLLVLFVLEVENIPLLRRLHAVSHGRKPALDDET